MERSDINCSSDVRRSVCELNPPPLFVIGVDLIFKVLFQKLPFILSRVLFQKVVGDKFGQITYVALRAP